MIWIELIIFLICILIGSRVGGIGMGTLGGIGLIIFVFIFKLPPGGPPVIVLGMIIAVITALSSMEAAGGLDYLVTVAEKIMRKNPQRITFLAPIITYVLIFISGTQHVIYALLPVIAEISRKSGIRPERPISISVIASMQAIISSPISAATVALLATLAIREVALTTILIIIIPSTFLAVFVGILFVRKKGLELKDDPIFQEKIKENNFDDLVPNTTIDQKQLVKAKGSTFLFLATVLLVVIIGVFPNLRPTYNYIENGYPMTDKVEMALAIMILMLGTGGIILLVFKASAKKAVRSATMTSGIVAVISILGISWLGSSFFDGNKTEIVVGISDIIKGKEWFLAIGLFLMSVLLFSQASTIVTLIPVALALDIPTNIILASYPAVSGIFFLPTYGTVLAAISFDKTGTTKTGKYILNHSFMLPGIVVTITAVLFAYILSSITL